MSGMDVQPGEIYVSGEEGVTTLTNYTDWLFYPHFLASVARGVLRFLHVHLEMEEVSASLSISEKIVFGFDIIADVVRLFRAIKMSRAKEVNPEIQYLLLKNERLLDRAQFSANDSTHGFLQQADTYNAALEEYQSSFRKYRYVQIALYASFLFYNACRVSGWLASMFSEQFLLVFLVGGMAIKLAGCSIELHLIQRTLNHNAKALAESTTDFDTALSVMQCPQKATQEVFEDLCAAFKASVYFAEEQKILYARRRMTGIQVGFYALLTVASIAVVSSAATFGFLPATLVAASLLVYAFCNLAERVKVKKLVAKRKTLDIETFKGPYTMYQALREKNGDKKLSIAELSIIAGKNLVTGKGCISTTLKDEAERAVKTYADSRKVLAERLTALMRILKGTSVPEHNLTQFYSEIKKSAFDFAKSLEYMKVLISESPELLGAYQEMINSIVPKSGFAYGADGRFDCKAFLDLCNAKDFYGLPLGADYEKLEALVKVELAKTKKAKPLRARVATFFFGRNEYEQVPETPLTLGEVSKMSRDQYEVKGEYAFPITPPQSPVPGRRMVEFQCIAP